VVIDAGLQRRSQFDPNSGMARLITTRISRSSAEQRAGRAGRLEPGVCYRLWSQGEHQTLPAFTPPEILEADLAAMVLELARWGTLEPGQLTWLDPPPRAHWQQAVDLLQSLDALDEAGRLTQHGRKLLEPGLHPRLAHLLIRGRERGLGTLAAELAALLSERDLLIDRPGSDLVLRHRALRTGRGAVHRGRLAQVRKLARSLDDRSGPNNADTDHIGRLLMLAFPDRIGQNRSRRGRFLLSNGRGAFLFDDDALAGNDFLVAAELDGQSREARIYLAAAVDRRDLEQDMAARIKRQTVAEWDEKRGTVVAFERRLLGALVLSEKPVTNLDAATLEAGLLDAVRRRGLDALNWSEKARQWRARASLAHQLWPDDWPDFGEPALTDELDTWLGPFLSGKRRWTELNSIDLLGALKARLDYPRLQQLDELLPPSLTIPTGRSVNLDYTVEGGPILATKLQSVFGWTATPRIARGQLPVVLHLLSPAGRPLAVTADLESFWANAYPDVRKDMRGRYPKHPWPEDPFSAVAKEGVKHPKKK